MISQKTKITSVIAVLAIVSIATMIVLSQTQNIVADTPKGNNVYVFAEGVSPHVTFNYGAVTEEADFQVYTQTSGTGGTNGRGTQPQFTLVKVPSADTPYLYKAADELLTSGNRGSHDWQYNRFDVKVDLRQAGQPVRSFVYEKCEVNTYRVYTDYDKEEGYVTGGKTGFALQDEYSILCVGFTPVSPVLKQMEFDANHQPLYK